MMNSNTKHISENSLIIEGILIRQDADGRVCLNDCHRASGGDPNKRPQMWLRNDQAKSLIKEIIDAQICASPVSIIKGGLEQGTYAVKELVYAYAMWISPSFNIHVIQAYNALINHQTNCPHFLIPKTYAEALRLAADQAETIKKLEIKGDAFDRISKSDGSFCITDAAKILQITPKRLFNYLNRWNWIYRRFGNRHWCGYQSKINSGYLEQKTTEINYPDGSTKVTEQVRITSKGIAKLSKIFSSEMEKAA